MSPLIAQSIPSEIQLVSPPGTTKLSDLIEHTRHPPITNAMKQFRHLFKEGIARMEKIKRELKCGSHLSPRAGVAVDSVPPRPSVSAERVA
ncbi:hypothetical protein M9458_045017, partial [Cirrhinus mrigala]